MKRAVVLLFATVFAAILSVGCEKESASMPPVAFECTCDVGHCLGCSFIPGPISAADIQAKASVFNYPPVVVITYPADGASVLASWTGTINVFATDVDGDLVSVEVLLDSKSLGAVTNAPYDFPASALSWGKHIIVAIATDSNGEKAVSNFVTFTIIKP
ncbi:MAG: Ig-like domain-containing protein [Patescibacteria group bacterium]|nr:Ig-like domain-containing protein [Patescibacteria group bacterium]